VWPARQNKHDVGEKPSAQVRRDVDAEHRAEVQNERGGAAGEGGGYVWDLTRSLTTGRT